MAGGHAASLHHGLHAVGRGLAALDGGAVQLRELFAADVDEAVLLQQRVFFIAEHQFARWRKAM